MSEQGQDAEKVDAPAPVAASSPGLPSDVPPGLPEDFIETLYLALNPDVAEAVAEGVWPSGAAHVLALGWQEQRPSLAHELRLAPALPWSDPDPAADKGGFDAAGYLALHPDLALALGNDPSAAWEHWLAFGRLEGRLGPGAAPHAQRGPSLDGLLARPFGIELYAPFGDEGARGAQARALLADLLRAGIPTEARAFDIAGRLPRIATREQAGPGRRRISLLLAEPLELAALAALYPPDHFAASYVIGAWSVPAAAFRPGWYATFGALDELWVIDEPARQAFVSFAPVPVHAVPLPLPLPPTAPVSGSAEPGTGALVLLVPGGGGSAVRMAADMLDAVGRALDADDTPPVQLVLTGSGAPIAARLQRLIADATGPAAAGATLLQAPLSPQVAARLAQAGRLLVVTEDGLDGLFAAQAFAAAGKPVLAPHGSVLARRLGGAVRTIPVQLELSVLPDSAVRTMQRRLRPEIDGLARAIRAALDAPDDHAADGDPAGQAGRPADEAEQIQPMLRRLALLGLDLPPPPFLSAFGRSAGCRTPAISERLSGSWPGPLGTVDRRPTISILLPVGDAGADMLGRCVDSVLEQIYPFWTLSLIADGTLPEPTRRLIDALRGSHPQLRVDVVPDQLDPAAQVNRAADECAGTHLLLLRPDERLEPDALSEIADALEAASPALLYADEATGPVGEGPGTVTSRPDWSPEQLRSENHLGFLLVIERLAWQRLGGLAEGFGVASGYELALRLIELGEPGAHLAQAVLRREAPARSDPAAEQRALQAHAMRTGARLEPGSKGTMRFRPAAPAAQPVSIVVTIGPGEAAHAASGPASGRSAAVKLVRSVRRWLRAAAGEILVVSASRPSDSELAALQAQAARLETVSKAGAGRARLRNAGLSRAKHPLVLFLDPRAVPEPDLLAALLEAMHDPAVAAAGPWLPPHSGHGLARPDIVRNVSALPGACLMLRREAGRLVRGYDETLSPDLAADIDLCLRLRASGQRLVSTPHGTIEGSAVGAEDQALAIAALSRAWSDESLDRFELNRMPRRRAPKSDAPGAVPVGTAPTEVAGMWSGMPPVTPVSVAPGPAATRPDLSLPPEELDLAAILAGLAEAPAPASASARAPAQLLSPVPVPAPVPIPAAAPADPARPAALVEPGLERRPEPLRPLQPPPVSQPAPRRSSWRRSS